MTQTASETPKASSRKTTMIVAAVLALGLLAGAGWLVVALSRGATPAAAKGLPANSLAVVEFNLNPAASDKLAVKELASKFPTFADGVAEAGDDYKAALYSLLSTEDSPSYEEISSWLGDSMAVAAVPHPDAEVAPHNLLPVWSFEVTDRDQALAFAEAQLPDLVPIMVGDLMVVAHPEAALTADAVGNNSLANNATYTADLTKLGDGYLATAWVSEDLLAARAKDLPASSSPRVIMGAKVSDGTLALRMLTTMSDGIPAGDSVRDLADSLPSDSSVAWAASIPADVIDQAWAHIEALDAESRAPLTELGITSANDLRALVGSEIALTADLGLISSGGLIVRTDNPAGHQAILKKLLTKAGITATDSVVDGDRVITTFDTTADELTAPGTKLGSNEAYQALTGGIDTPTSVAWVDVSKLSMVFSLFVGDPAIVDNLSPITGIGMVGGKVDDNTTETWIRIGTT